MKKKIFSILVLSAFVLLGSTTFSGCKTKEGCGLEDKYKENLSSKKRGKSNLWSKKQRKKIKSR